ncbi:MAG TPA: MFS transporter [Candidatus Limnocylindria bacterium]|nr:MFS transporter [Candidatus Limnocylindria bacterium]
MSSSDIRKRISGLYYGWRMIGVVSALRILGGGLHQYGFTVFFLPVSQDLGLTRASTSLAFSLARAEGSLTAPIVGYLLDRYGPKPLMLTAALFAGVGYILFAFVHSYTTFLIVYLGVISLAFNAGFVHAPTVVANSWFIKLRARAMTVVSAAVPIGGAIITPLLAVAVQNFGWRWAALIAGGLFIAGGIPLSLAIRRSPESVGMAPDGGPLELPQGDNNGTPSTNNAVNEPEVSARQAFRSPIFWNLILSMTARSAAFTTVTTHFIPMMVWKGMSQTEASVLLAGFAIINLPIHFLLGWIADFVNKPKLVTLCLLLGFVAVLPMLWSDSLWALWFFTALYSVLDASIPVFWASVGDFFGRKSFGAIRGNMNLFYTWGAVLGPVLAGYVYDRTQSYALVFWAMAGSLLLSSAMTSLLIRPWANLRRG